jgi:DNA mismatch repair ATPase MutS
MKIPPTSEQIASLKAGDSELLLLFHNDGFYEAFDADAGRLVGLLELKYFNIRQPARTTTHFHGSDLERYLAKLVAAGCRVALVGRVQGEEIVHHVQVTGDYGEPD